MFFHKKQLQYFTPPEQPDAIYAMKMQELIGGTFGEMTVMYNKAALHFASLQVEQDCLNELEVEQTLSYQGFTEILCATPFLYWSFTDRTINKQYI